VTLFTLTITGMVTMVSTSALASLYADDIVIYCGCQSIATVEHWLEVGINCLSHWVLKERFLFSATKTESIHFTWLWDLHPPNILLNNSAVLFAQSVKFQGLLRDSTHSGEPNWRWLWTEWNGRSSGGNVKVTLHLDCALICYNLL
jgi:hypothetical protein